jgi:hypothetical protein
MEILALNTFNENFHCTIHFICNNSTRKLHYLPYSPFRILYRDLELYYRQPATSCLDFITKGSSAKLCAFSSIGVESLNLEVVRVQHLAESAPKSRLADMGLQGYEGLERRFRDLSAHFLAPPLKEERLATVLDTLGLRSRGHLRPCKVCPA